MWLRYGFSFFSLMTILLLVACGQAPDAGPSQAQEAAIDGPRKAEGRLAPFALPEGSWGGEFKFDDEPRWILMVADFTENTSDLTITIGFPLNEELAPVTSVVQIDPHGDTTAIRFEIPFERAGVQQPLAFAGRLTDDKITGQISHGQARGVFELAPLADFAPEYFEGRT